MISFRGGNMNILQQNVIFQNKMSLIVILAQKKKIEIIKAVTSQFHFPPMP